jgi:hypothetical protein
MTEPPIYAETVDAAAVFEVDVDMEQTDLLEPEDDDQPLLPAPAPTGPEDLGDDMTQDDGSIVLDEDDDA